MELHEEARSTKVVQVQGQFFESKSWLFCKKRNKMDRSEISVGTSGRVQKATGQRGHYQGLQQATIKAY